MKGFKLSINSWHYKLYDSNWRNPSEPDNFCNYFWATMWEVFKRFLIAFILVLVVAIVCAAVYSSPFGSLFVVSVITLYACLCIKVEEWKSNRNRKTPVEKGPGFFKLKYKAIKGKYCPKIDWVD